MDAYLRAISLMPSSRESGGSHSNVFLANRLSTRRDPSSPLTSAFFPAKVATVLGSQRGKFRSGARRHMPKAISRTSSPIETVSFPKTGLAMYHWLLWKALYNAGKDVSESSLIPRTTSVRKRFKLRGQFVPRNMPLQSTHHSRVRGRENVVSNQKLLKELFPWPQTRVADLYIADSIGCFSIGKTAELDETLRQL